MIDYESLSLFAEHLNLVQSHMMNYVTIFFALVVTSHFVAKNLPTSFVFFILLIYTAFAISNLNLIGSSVIKMESLRSAAGENVPPGYWEPTPLAALNSISFFFVYIGSYIAAVAFTLYMKFKKD